MSADRMERVREKAREFARYVRIVASTRDIEAIYSAGADAYRTLTDAEWEQTQEKVARELAHFEEGLDVDRNVDHMGDYGLGVAPVWRAYEKPAESAMRAMGFRREGATDA